MKKMLFLGSQMETGGAQKILLDQAHWFYKKGYKVEVAFFYDKEGLFEQWQKAPFIVHDLRAWEYKGNIFRNGIRLVIGVIRLIGLMIRGKFDVIETFTPDSNLIGIPLAWVSGIKTRVATHHSYIQGTGVLRQRLHGILINSPITTILVAVSKRVRLLAEEKEYVSSNKIEVILNGIPRLKNASDETVQKLRVELGVKKNQLMVLSIGRLSIQKGHTYLIDAISRLSLEYKNYLRFFIAGSGDLHNELENKIRELKIENQISLLGIRKDIPALLQAADIFVLPSIWEGLPLVILEAMSAGLPILTTDVEGIDDVIINGESGIVTPLKDSYSLVDNLTYMVNNESLRRKIGNNAQIRFEENYTLEKMCLRYEEIFLLKTLS